jgi:hypothetical protein
MGADWSRGNDGKLSYLFGFDSLEKKICEDFLRFFDWAASFIRRRIRVTRFHSGTHGGARFCQRLFKKQNTLLEVRQTVAHADSRGLGSMETLDSMR